MKSIYHLICFVLFGFIIYSCSIVDIANKEENGTNSTEIGNNDPVDPVIPKPTDVNGDLKFSVSLPNTINSILDQYGNQFQLTTYDNNKFKILYYENNNKINKIWIIVDKNLKTMDVFFNYGNVVTNTSIYSNTFSYKNTDSCVSYTESENNSKITVTIDSINTCRIYNSAGSYLYTLSIAWEF